MRDADTEVRRHGRPASGGLAVTTRPVQTAPTLRAQVASTMLELERVRARVDRLRQVDPALHERFQRVLGPDLAARWAELEGLAAARGAPSPARWEALGTAKAACDILLSEAHDFIQGALVRQADLDDGLCVIADRLLDGLSERCGIPWGRLSVPADSEFVSDLASIVRLRAGDVSVWHLPVAAHEFGHYVGPKITVGDRQPFADELATHRVGSYGWSRAHELFADAFAVYTIGPSFLAACIISRFLPQDSSVVSDTHPAHRDRVWFMVRLADAIDREAPGRPWSAILDHLDATWRANLSAAGQPAEVDDADARRLGDDAARYLGYLRSGIASARYGGMIDARRAEEVILGASSPAPPGATIADVLNGAWLSRLDQPITDVASLRRRGEVALRLAREAPGA